MFAASQIHTRPQKAHSVLPRKDDNFVFILREFPHICSVRNAFRHGDEEMHLFRD
jgi:hypothetical protein